MRALKGLAALLAIVLLVVVATVAYLMATDQFSGALETLGLKDEAEEVIDAEPSPTSSPSPSTPASAPQITIPPDAIQYTDVNHVVDEINEQIKCTGKKVLTEKNPEQGLCYVDGGEFEVDIYVFEDPGLTVAGVQGLREAGYELPILAGGNWFLTVGDDQLTEDIQAHIGGEVFEL